MSGTETITGSPVKSSHASEYSVSKLGHGTALNSTGGNARMWLNAFIGPKPGRAPASVFVICRRVVSIITSGYRYR